MNGAVLKKDKALGDIYCYGVIEGRGMTGFVITVNFSTLRNDKEKEDKRMDKELISKIEQWFVNRNLIEADPGKQILKLIEETGELASGIARDDKELIKDSIGDIGIVLIGLMLQIKKQKNSNCVTIYDNIPGSFNILDLQGSIGFIIDSARLQNYGGTTLQNANILFRRLSCLAEEYGQDFKECLESAYDEIKDRKGRLVNGVFIKEEDLK